MNPHASQTTIENNAARLRDFHQSLTLTFDSPDGQRVLAWLHASAGTRKPCFRPSPAAGAGGNPLDPFAAAVRDGRTGLVWEIEENLRAARAALSSPDQADKPKTRSRSASRIQRP